MKRSRFNNRRAPIGRRTPTRQTPTRYDLRKTARAEWLTLRDKSDTLFSKIIRSAGRCRYCGSTYALEAAHIIGRAHNVTRCDLNNAICLCTVCHYHFTNSSKAEWSFWVDHVKGAGYYQTLWTEANDVRLRAGSNVDFWTNKHTELKAHWAEIEKHQC